MSHEFALMLFIIYYLSHIIKSPIIKPHVQHFVQLQVHNIGIKRLNYRIDERFTIKLSWNTSDLI